MILKAQFLIYFLYCCWKQNGMWKKSQRVTGSSDRFVLVFTVFIKLLFGSLDSAEKRITQKIDLHN